MKPQRATAPACLAVALLIAFLAGCSRPEPRVEVIYFHRTIRCPSCEQIQKWTQEAVNADVKAGRVSWLVLNLDEPPNTQYEERYNLMAQSVVLSMKQGERELKWKNLDKVWDLLDDESVFKKYIQTELNAFMAKPGAE